MRILPFRIQVPLSICGALIVVIGGALISDSHFDAPVTRWFNSLNDGTLGAATNFVYSALQPIFSATACIVGITIYLVRRNPWRPLVAFAVTVVLAWLPVIIFKKVFQRPRIDFTTLENVPTYLPHDWAYPSGHTAFIVGLSVSLLIATYGTVAQRIVRCVAPIAILAVVLCVLMVGVHFVSDAIASVIWAFSLAPLSWKAVNVALGAPNRDIAR